MKKLYITLVAFVVTFASLVAVAQVTPTADKIDVLINDLDFKKTVIAEHNEVVDDIGALKTNQDANATAAVVWQVNTNANIPALTAITPEQQYAVLFMPNCTNTYSVDAVNVGATSVVSVTYVQRLAVNLDGTTNGWERINTENQ